MSQKINPKKIVSKIFDKKHTQSTKPDVDKLSRLSMESQPKMPVLFQKLSSRISAVIWKNEFAGIDFGNDSIKFVLLAQEKRRLVLKEMHIEPIPRLSDFGKPEDGARETLNCLVKIASRIKSKVKVGLGLNDLSLLTDIISVPKGNESEMRDAMRKEMSEQHLIDPKTHFLDYVQFDAAPFSQSKVSNLLVVAVPQDLVYKQFEIAQTAGFKVIAVETNSLAALSAVKRVSRWEKNERVVILDVGAKFTNLTVLMGSKILLCRLIPFAGDRISLRIADSVGCNFVKAEQLKMQHTLKNDSESDTVDKIILEETQKLLAEIGKSLQFVFAKESSEELLKVNHVFMVGGGSKLYGLKDAISKHLESSVKDVDLLSGIYVDEALDSKQVVEQAHFLSVSLGLALRVTDWSVLPFGLGMPG